MKSAKWYDVVLFSLIVAIMAGVWGIMASAQSTQAKPPVEAVQEKVKAPEAPTELEQLKMQVAALMNQIKEQTKETHKAIEERDDARLQLVLMQAAPIREGFTYDWGTGSFRHTATGKVWDFTKKELVADDKTPKAIK